MTTLLVGERFNNVRRPLWERMDALAWYRLGLRLGAFVDVGRYDNVRLESLGFDLEGTTSLNLTPPAPQGVPFDMARAMDVAAIAAADPDWDLYVLVGRRVMTAFGVCLVGTRCAGPWGAVIPSRVREGARFVCVPHPSGLTRFWNDEVEVELLRSLLVSEGVV